MANWPMKARALICIGYYVNHITYILQRHFRVLTSISYLVIELLSCSRSRLKLCDLYALYQLNCLKTCPSQRHVPMYSLYKGVPRLLSWLSVKQEKRVLLKTRWSCKPDCCDKGFVFTHMSAILSPASPVNQYQSSPKLLSDVGVNLLYPAARVSSFSSR